ncbi:hypothetical protein CEUSTIGMA_g12148.t1 [Chlamydomonas eustigma]|uniref:Vacuolar protein-sorting-associated protein 36 n=1 Tax=Chlamydomonas eustigma TaxID=1157962 RepID=A0A250XNX4_9CHLO|nr:hypothetical protein CEUSTIGMA_g12148.t1 [Chlamydomonas eustigma]|eukprot:GAX84726.1 hypothetical protein CEUSTIGMA_g12148.t1 [Chlamydomonas eustigma]
MIGTGESVTNEGWFVKSAKSTAICNFQMILDQVHVTASGRASLKDKEIEISMLDQADLEYQDGLGGVIGFQSAAYKGGYLVLTTQRMIWMCNSAGPPSSSGCPCCLPLHSILDIKKKSQLTFSGTKVRLALDIAANYKKEPTRADGQFHTTLQLVIRCRGESPDTFMAKMKDMLRNRTEPSSTTTATQPQAASTTLTSASSQATTVSSQGDTIVLPRPVDESLLCQLVDMGFSRNQAARSLMATHNTGCQPAIDYILAFGDQPGMNDPLPPPAQQQGQNQYSPGIPHPPQQGPLQKAAVPAVYNANPCTAFQAPAIINPNYQGQPYPAPYNLNPSTALQPPAPNLNYQGGFIGVAGIVRREEQKATDASRSLSVAFQDLQALMDMAAEMVKLAERFRGVMSQVGQGNEDELMDRDTQLQLIEMGITSPVTKESAGARYSVELSRQLADFLERPLQQCGGIMTLPDAYCLYNRARGAELVSPEDLLLAIKMFSQLGLPLKLHTLPSGIPVVQSAAHSVEAVCSRIAQLLEELRTTSSSTSQHAPELLGSSVSATDIAKAFSISLPVAREHLLTAELRGMLCRDDGPEGLRFYTNFFHSVSI